MPGIGHSGGSGQYQQQSQEMVILFVVRVMQLFLSLIVRDSVTFTIIDHNLRGSRRGFNLSIRRIFKLSCILLAVIWKIHLDNLLHKSCILFFTIILKNAMNSYLS